MLEAPIVRREAEAAPVVDIGNGDVVETAGDAVAHVVAQDRQVDDLGHFVRDDFRKMTDAARVLGFTEQRHLAAAAEIFKVAPDQVAEKRRGMVALGS